MPPKARSQSMVGSRDRILKAAITRFSKRSYEQASLRDIAADVGVDVAYVHRCFGSKERLFAEALKASAQIDERFTGPADGVAGSLARYVVSERPRRGHALDIIIRSLASGKAAPLLRRFVLDSFVDPLAEELDQSNTVPIAVIAALLAGVSIFRNVLRMGPLLNAPSAELEALIANAIRGMMDAADPATAATMKLERTP
ncbi:TetR/AcrR family transcriptional regulator [Bradyrhizobium sp. INPA01-394B]|uniref:TetR family transcriptional regulator n=2 Tax=Bradyrhizobium campsiandrae TaxID=1729892 RepID=A0ABR7U4M3_9BRAD|nr:TetR/AcrR family transcriptional regulator [Bradyrhizobium campsiandrae]MBC9979013.1 TetR family transcriptional regulator [Bradyrhizobium campsiandrae]